MNQPTNFPEYTAEEAESRETFLSLMWALSYPGRVHDLPGHAPDQIALFAQIGHALLDLETTFFTPDSVLAAQLKLAAARSHPVETAAYHFYPIVGQNDLSLIERASIGTTLFPDQSATLFLGCARLAEGTQFTLTGPGIKGQQQVNIAGIPSELWSLRKRAIYPMGWDIFIVDPAGKVIGLPRTTKIEFEGQE